MILIFRKFRKEKQIDVSCRMNLSEIRQSRTIRKGYHSIIDDFIIFPSPDYFADCADSSANILLICGQFPILRNMRTISYFAEYTVSPIFFYFADYLSFLRIIRKLQEYSRKSPHSPRNSPARKK